ncbi:MAG: ABC transporter permease [Rhodospirillales bacterium]|nr:ABC transporter permease [Rhodospirillales bacterium]
MGVTAFNSPGFPRAAPWECLTFEWFEVLSNDKRIVNGLINSFIIGLGTVILSVVLGLAGALMLTQIYPKLRATYYTIIIAPILIPGVVLGISTLVFWDRVNIMLGLGSDSILHNGLLLTILGQSTFIASYCMLVFLARLQRFDMGLTEAALDLGATNVQAFRKILLPFLAPAIASAAVLAFLASFENYNTTTFTFGKYPTLTIELAQKVRYGIDPSISALAFTIVVLTIFAALINEVSQRRKQLAIANGAPVAAFSGRGIKLPGFLRGNPAALVLLVLTIGAVTTISYASTYSPEACKLDVREQKRQLQQQQIEKIKQQRLQQKQDNAVKGPDIFGSDKSKVAPATGPVPESPGKGTFGGVFAPGNLEQAAPKPESKIESPGKGTFGNVFAPGNLEQAAPKPSP